MLIRQDLAGFLALELSSQCAKQGIKRNSCMAQSSSLLSVEMRTWMRVLMQCLGCYELILTTLVSEKSVTNSMP